MNATAEPDDAAPLTGEGFVTFELAVQRPLQVKET
jgi:hypothetical protein